MKLKVKLKGLCCAGCAAKIEEKIAKLDGVNNVSVNFLMEKMTVDTDEIKLDEIKPRIEKIVRKLEPDVEMEYM